MKRIESILVKAQNQLSAMLIAAIKRDKQITAEPYARFLSMQYHLTKDVQKDMFTVAASPALAKHRKLRDFLYNFGIEEEPHFLLAEKDLKDLGHAEPLTIPLDVKLWKGYFAQVCYQQPFIRLGGTCVLESIGTGVADIIHGVLKDSSTVINRSSRFLRIHLHTAEGFNHGEQVMEALEGAKLNESELAQLEQGATEAMVVYLRMIHWVLHGSYLGQSQFEAPAADLAASSSPSATATA